MRASYFKMMFVFLDSLTFFAFMQNNCCGTKLKAILCRCILRNFLSIDLSNLLVIGNRVKQDLLIIYIVKY